MKKALHAFKPPEISDFESRVAQLVTEEHGTRLHIKLCAMRHDVAPCEFDRETGLWKENPKSRLFEDMQRWIAQTSMRHQLHLALSCEVAYASFCQKYLYIGQYAYPKRSIMLWAWTFMQRLWLVEYPRAILSEDAMHNIIREYMRLQFKEIADDLRITPLVVGTLFCIEGLRATFEEQRYGVMTDPRRFMQGLCFKLQQWGMAIKFVDLENVPAYERITSAP